MFLLFANNFALFWLGNVLVLPFIVAIPGNYISLPEFKDKTLANVLQIIPTDSVKECDKLCQEHPVCNGFAYSPFQKSCELYELKPNSATVQKKGYVLYFRKRSEQDGYIIYKSDYIKAFFDLTNYVDSKSYCKSYHGDLVAIKDEGLNTLVRSIMIDHDTFNFLIGLTDEEKENEWKYSNGDIATFLNFDYDGKWDRRDKNCAVMKSNGKWKHDNCKHLRYFVCQIPII